MSTNKEQLPESLILKEMQLGKSIARMYIDAQGVSVKVSAQALQLIQSASNPMKTGFNSEIKNTNLTVQA